MSQAHTANVFHWAMRFQYLTHLHQQVYPNGQRTVFDHVLACPEIMGKQNEEETHHIIIPNISCMDGYKVMAHPLLVKVCSLSRIPGDAGVLRHARWLLTVVNFE
jgi:hypothetical protein